MWRHRIEIHFLGEKNHQDAASVVELAEITCQKWSISGETGHKSLYLPSRIAHQLVEVNRSIGKRKMDHIVMLLTIIPIKMHKIYSEMTPLIPTYPHILAKIQKTVEYFSIP